MTSYDRVYRPLEGTPTPGTSQLIEKTEPTAQDILNLMEIRSLGAIRLYETSIGKGTLDSKLEEGTNGSIRKMSKREKLAIYTYLRDNAMLSKMVDDYDIWDFYLEVADYFRREFKLKI